MMEKLILVLLTAAVMITPTFDDATLSHTLLQQEQLITEGRTDGKEYTWPGCSFNFSFSGSTEARVSLVGLEGSDVWFQVLINDQPHHKFHVAGGVHTDSISGFDSAKTYKITYFRRTEGFTGRVFFDKVLLGSGAIVPTIQDRMYRPLIEFIGNSITCGYGNEGPNAECPFTSATENNYLAYGAVAARGLGMRYSCVAWSGRGIYRAYGEETPVLPTLPQLYNLTSPLDTAQTWNFKNPADWVVINLGTNDFWNGLPPKDAFLGNYMKFLKEVRKHNPQCRIIVCVSPMMSDQYPVGAKCRSTLAMWLDEMINKAKAQGIDKVTRFSFSEQGALGYGCDWHPNVAQHQKMAEELSAYITSLSGR